MVSVNHFIAMHPLEKHNNIYVSLYNKNPFLHKVDNKVLVDMDRLVKRRKFYDMIWHEAQDNYYKLTESMIDRQIAKMMAELDDRYSIESWNDFICRSLFSQAYQDSSLLKYKTTKRLWSFWRLTRMAIRIRK